MCLHVLHAIHFEKHMSGYGTAWVLQYKSGCATRAEAPTWDHSIASSHMRKLKQTGQKQFWHTQIVAPKSTIQTLKHASHSYRMRLSMPCMCAKMQHLVTGCYVSCQLQVALCCTVTVMLQYDHLHGLAQQCKPASTSDCTRCCA